MGNSSTKGRFSSETFPSDESLSSDNGILSLLLLAVDTNNVNLIKSLKKLGVSLNMTDSRDNTLLHLLVINESTDLFKYLLEQSEINIDAINCDGFSALNMALVHSKKFHASRLIEKGASVHISDRWGFSPLHHAVMYNSPKICEQIIKNGADLNARNVQEETPLYLACLKGNVEVISMLLYYGADASIPCKQGNIPLLILKTGMVNSHLEEVLYNYTFDEKGMVMELKIFVRAMILKLPFFKNMVDKVTKVTYNISDLDYFNESLPDITARDFEIFFEKFDYVVKDMLCHCCTLTNYLIAIESLKKTNTDFIDVLYVLLNSHLVSEVIQSCCPSVSVISSLIKIFHKNNIPLTILTKLVCCFLSYGIDMNPSDLNAAYVFYGNCELFQIMLHMDIIRANKKPCCTICDYEVVQESVMAHFAYDIDLTIDKFLEKPQWLLAMDLDVLLNYFAVPKLKDFFLLDCVTSPKIHNKLTKLPTVPKLIEIARDVSREYIIEKFQVRNCKQFYTVIKWLPIANVYKKILCYQKELYRT